jgi:tetratricopeptide (TPR) repeat protein
MNSLNPSENFTMTQHRSLVACAGILALTLICLGGCAEKLEVYRTRGIRQYDAGQYDQALATFNKALTYDQFDARSNTYAGLIQYQQGNYEQAAYHARVALQSDPSSEEAKDCLTAALIKLNKPDLALDALERSAALAEKVSDPRWKRTFVKTPYKDQVKENLYYGKVEDRVRIGRAYETLGDYDNAVLWYKKAIELTPRSTQAMLALAKLYDKLGNKAEAKNYLVRAYNVDPSTPGLTEAMTKNGIAISEIISR